MVNFNELLKEGPIFAISLVALFVVGMALIIVYKVI